MDIDITKTLFISDIDGTLTNSKHMLSDLTINTINNLISSGVYFTVSTARTPATLIGFLAPLKISIPVCTMNGSCIYDIRKNKFIKRFLIDKQPLAEIFEIIDRHNLHCFAFDADENTLLTYHTKINNIHSQEFYDKRKNLSDKLFSQIERYADITGRDISFIALINTCEYVHNLYEKIKHIKGITINYYRDHLYSELFYLEITTDKGSKGIAAEWVRDYLGLEKIIAFGDNLNDIELFRHANLGFAVSNANQTLKDIATEIIGSNNDDAVVKKILSLIDKK